MSDLRQLDAAFLQHRVDPILREGGVAALERLLMEQLTFVSAPTDHQREPQDLVPGGAFLPVTEENKLEYVQRLCEEYVCGGIRREIRCTLQGFWDIFPLDMLQAQAVKPIELSAFLSSSGSLDPEEWRWHSRSNSKSVIVEWFWDVVRDLAEEQRGLLLRFVTGSSRLPPGGFVKLTPQFSVDVSSSGSPNHLPQAHTCVNKIVLYQYTSKVQLSSKLSLAFSSEGFYLP
eukprot:CAMPEP_0170588778 /NCGR_PEP_ID=MMETSP0224-20130122/11012_1 /TAXON_ID=285029 /ORGANISM="Togula jolla, Strain CCCM 725" /LENGTH=230 /DNA_ID=CAMNT_0010912519 /DNA_START=37 /DNA_END=729 /DNA_ORIENTATION=-